MVMAYQDITGRRSGRLVVKKFHHFGPTGVQHWLCKCACGRTCIVTNIKLLTGKVRACDACEKGIPKLQTPLAIERARARHYRYVRGRVVEQELKRKRELARNYYLESRPAVKASPLPTKAKIQ